MGYRNVVRTVAEPAGNGVAVTVGGARLLGVPVDAVAGPAVAAIRPE